MLIMELKMKTGRFRKSKGSLGIFAAGMIALAVPASAHDIWMTADKVSGSTVVADIGFGDRDNRMVADPARIITLDVIAPSGVTHLPTRKLKVAQRMGQPTVETEPFDLEKGSVVAMTYDNGYWMSIPGRTGSFNTTTLFAGAGTDRHWTIKYSKMLYGAGAYKVSLNQRCELIALKDPFTLKHGEALPVRVMYEGKPLAGTEVQYDDGVSPVPDAQSPKVKTGADGVAMIPMDRTGPYLIVVDLNKPPHDTHFVEYDHVYGALSFDLNN
jgi:nickel transport protein